MYFCKFKLNARTSIGTEPGKRRYDTMEKKTIPVLLLTGYLGSGKTTLVNNILSNRKGIRFAVIVNDIGEVNIDADLIQKGGVVGSKDDSLVALQNGCICCTLKADLVEQIYELMKMQRFDYIVIEASGICEPEPIAQTICTIPTLGEAYRKYGICRLDCIVTVVDALRMESEFGCGDGLTRKDIGEEDIENLIIRQIEFCNIILLNKASEVKPGELARIRQIIRTIQPRAEIIECDYTRVDLDRLIGTGLFDFDKVASTRPRPKRNSRPGTTGCTSNTTAGNMSMTMNTSTNTDITIITMKAVKSRNTASEHLSTTAGLHSTSTSSTISWQRNGRRASSGQRASMSYLFEQAGRQKLLREAGQWYATAPEEDRLELMRQDPNFFKDWDEKYGDRMQKIVFIGQNMDKEQIVRDLDMCLE